MIKLDDDLLQELGLAGLPQEEKKKLLAHIYETLEMRVGMKLAEQMSDAQLREFEQFIDRNDEGGALKWLETNFPNYKDVVAAEFERLKIEISQVAPQILAAGTQQQQGNGQDVPQQMPPQHTSQPPYQPPQPQAPQQTAWQSGQGQQQQPGYGMPPQGQNLADPWGSPNPNMPNINNGGTPPPPPPPPRF